MPQTKREGSFLLALCLLAGAVAVSLVYLGAYWEWPNFSVREGYFGTHFMDDILYAINEPWAIHIVAFVWFFYAASAVFLFGLVFTVLRRAWGARNEKGSR